MATRTPRKTTPAKKTTAKKATPARKPAAKKALPKTAPVNNSTVVDTRSPLPVRRKVFTGPMGVHEQAAIRAALDAAALRLPVPVRSWHGSQAQLADGLILIHNPGPDRTFTAHIACQHGGIHNHPIRTLDDLKEARAVTRICTAPHGGANADQAIRDGVDTTSGTRTAPVLAVSEGLRRVATTQPLDANEVADGLAARAADTENPKEHPEP